MPNKKSEGVGLASLIHVGGGARVYKSDGCGSIIKIDDFGKVNVFTGATDMGQGSDNIVAQIVAEELGLNVEDVHVIQGDTDTCPWDVGAHASRTTFIAGNSAYGAAKKIKERIFQIASEVLEASTEDLVARDRMIYVKGSPQRGIEIGKLLRKAHYAARGDMLTAEYFYDPDNENVDKEFRGNTSMTYAFGTHGVRVKVDEETGKVTILQYVAAHDVGRAINPLLLEGQVYGGVMMGIGYALTEEILDSLPQELSSRVAIIPQATQSPARFAAFIGHLLRERLAQISELQVVNTLCNVTASQQAAARELAQKVELVLVIGGHNSANSRHLAAACREAGTEAHHIETAAELEAQWLTGRERVGITAGASTPDWAVEEVVRSVRKLAQAEGG